MGLIVCMWGDQWTLMCFFIPVHLIPLETMFLTEPGTGLADEEAPATLPSPYTLVQWLQAYTSSPGISRGGWGFALSSSNLLSQCFNPLGHLQPGKLSTFLQVQQSVDFLHGNFKVQFRKLICSSLQMVEPVLSGKMPVISVNKNFISRFHFKWGLPTQYTISAFFWVYEC